MKSSVIVIMFAAVVFSGCTPQPIVHQPLLRTESDFTKFVFTEYAKREISEKDYRPASFFVESNAPLATLAQTEDTLMFRNIETDTYLPEKYALTKPTPNPLNPGYILMGTKDKFGVQEYRKKDILFFIKITRKLPTAASLADTLTPPDFIETMTFFSNVRKAYYETPSSGETTPPPPPSTNPFTLRQVAAVNPVHKVLKKLDEMDGILEPGKNYEIYRLTVVDIAESALEFASGRFKMTENGQKVASISEQVKKLFEKYPKNSDYKFLFVGTASEKPLKPAKVDTPSFRNCKIYYWNKEEDILKREEFSRSDINYTNDELPKLRALETKKSVQEQLSGIFPDIEDRVFAVYENPRGEDIAPNRKIDIYVVMQTK